MSQPPTGQRDRVGDASNPARSNLQPAGSGNVSSVGGSPSPTLGTGYTQEQLQLQQQLLNQRAQQQRQQLIATAVAVAGGPGVIPAGVMATPGAVINILQQGILALRDPILNAQQVLCQSNLPEEIRQQARRIFQDNKLYSQLMERKLSDLQRVAQNTLSLPPQAGTATGIIAAPGGQSPNTTFAAAPPNPSSVANTTANTPSGAPSTNIAANTAATATTQLSKAKPASKGKKAAAATTTPVAPLPMTTTPNASSKAGKLYTSLWFIVY
ncbi:hypothetical protein BDF19DRAFT_150483 [Syncephalis fuscata]|nr:hypothetical protein BDF19DRAFT_150483 [Syncephalis fuscata]